LAGIEAQSRYSRIEIVKSDIELSWPGLSGHPDSDGTALLS
jgi:hypothetical protein